MEINNVDLENVHGLWDFFLLGCFLEHFPSLKSIQTLVDRLKVCCSILSHYNGWILFQFENGVDLEKVFADGPYFIFGRWLLLGPTTQLPASMWNEQSNQ